MASLEENGKEEKGNWRKLNARIQIDYQVQ